MSLNDTELFQSFCRKYINKAVKEHFKDVDVDDDNALDINVPRQLIRRICTHKDADPIMLSIGRLLVWWVEAKGLFDEYIYGMPSTYFHINNSFLPQVQLHFRESKYDAANNKREPARGRISFRWREEEFTTAKINALATKIKNDFAIPVFKFKKGEKTFCYWDNKKGYRFTIQGFDEENAKKAIKQVYNIQDEGEPDWEEFLKETSHSKNYNTTEYVKVMEVNLKKPKKRPIATVHFKYAELFIPGRIEPLVLVDVSGTKGGALKIA